MRMMPAPEGYALLMATRLLFERCARLSLLEQHANVEFRMPCKVEDIVYESHSRSVQGHTSAYLALCPAY